MLIILILTFSFTACYAQSDTAFAGDSAKYYSVTFFSVPDNAEIYSDTSFIGVTPLSGHRMKEGVYNFKFINPGSGNYWQNSNETVTLDLKSDTAVSVFFKFFYYFDSDPFNASVLFQDTLLGYTPLRLFTESKLTGDLIFRKKNYRDLIFKLEDYDFETGAKVKLLPKGKESLNESVYKDKGTQFNTKRNLPVIISLGVASIAGAYFTYDFKTKGNRDYDEYLMTGSQQKLDDSKKKDAYFVVSLILMQAAIGGLIYFLFFD
ncbi:MAG: hypothetical protein JSS91_10875 [Bacteroidetes bacterium]|nr:hypothetical protein [Bacteroidota bacterium]